MFLKPVLPIECRRFIRTQIDLNILVADVDHRGPRNFVLRSSTNAPPPNRAKPRFDSRMNASSENREANLEMIDVRPPVVVERDDDPVDAAHLRLVSIDALTIEQIAHDIHLSTPSFP